MSEWSELVSGVVGGGLVLVVQKASQVYSDYRDSKSIYDWLVSESKKPGAKTRRTTRAIAGALNLTPDRVVELCHHDKRIHTAVLGREDTWSIQPIRSGLNISPDNGE
jgi:hypothetical protein